MEALRKIYKVDEIAEILQVSKQTIWRWGREGIIETVRVGRCVRFFLPEQVETSLNEEVQE